MDQRAITDKACLFVIVGVASHEAGMEMIPDIQSTGGAAAYITIVARSPQAPPAAANRRGD